MTSSFIGAALDALGCRNIPQTVWEKKMENLGENYFFLGEN